MHDSKEASAILSSVDIEGTVILGDKAYGSRELRELIVLLGGAYCIPPQTNVKEPWEYDKELYKERHLIECFFQKLQQYRGIATRFAKLAARYLANVKLACIMMWLA